MRLKLLGFILFLYTSAAVAGISVTDNHGRVIDIAQPAQRVISLAPHVTENLYSVGAGDRIVGVASHSDFPAAAKQKPVIGDYQSFNLETIIALQPDLIIAWPGGNPHLPLQRVEQLGIPVYYSDPVEFADIPHNLRAFGFLMQLPQAEQAAAGFEAELKRLQQAYSGTAEVDVFYQLWNKPMLTINHSSMIDRVISLCGGRNLFHDHIEAIPRLSVESVLAVNPDVILTGEDVGADWQQQWLLWQEMTATRNKQFYQLNEDLLYRPTVRLLSGAEQMCRVLEKTRAVLNR